MQFVTVSQMSLSQTSASVLHVEGRGHPEGWGGARTALSTHIQLVRRLASWQQACESSAILRLWGSRTWGGGGECRGEVD